MDRKAGAAKKKPASPAAKTILIGYQRVSADDQHLHLQRDALIKTGVDPDRIYEDKLSGAKTNRPGWEHAIRAARKGDVLVVWRLDRLARSLKNLIGIAERLEEKGVGLRSLQEQIDTTSAAGRLFFHMMGALAEFERNLIRERTRAGPGCRQAPREEAGAEAEAQGAGPSSSSHKFCIGFWQFILLVKAPIHCNHNEFITI